MPDISDLIEQIRIHVNDYTKIQVNAVEEIPSTGKLNPLGGVNYWNELATGRSGEEFITKHMPLVSGCDAYLRGGRWYYKKLGSFPTGYNTSLRGFCIDYDRGMFIIPSGAPPIASGEKVKLSYAYWLEQEYRFPDVEIKKQISNGDSYIRDKGLSLSYEISGYGDTLDLLPFPSGIEFSVLALATSYFIRRRLEEEAIQDGIYVKDGDIAFDTTKTLAHRGKSLQEVKKDLDSVIKDIIMENLESAGERIDIYSTRDADYPNGIGSDQEILFNGEFIPWSGEDFNG